MVRPFHYFLTAPKMFDLLASIPALAPIVPSDVTS
jgi:hypothetical protein